MDRTPLELYERGEHYESEAKDSLNETVGRVLRLIIGSRWSLLISMLVVTLIAIPILLYVPNRYTSQAMLVLIPQQIHQRYVDPLVNMSNMDTIATMKREVLSTSGLFRIIRTVGLYDQEALDGGIEQLAAQLRKDIVIEFVGPQGPGRDPNTFTIAYTASNPQMAHEVTTRVTSMFIEENLKSRENQATTTTTFLAEQIEAARQKVSEHEQQLREFKTRHMGTLPEQEHANVGALTSLRFQHQSTTEKLNRARQQQRSIESTLEGTITRLQTERAELLGRLTPQHPEIVKKDQSIQRIGSLQALLKGERADVSRSQLIADSDPVITKLVNQVEDIRFEMESLSKEELRLQSDIAQYESRLRLAPVRQQQLSTLVRDYELYRQEYNDLLGKQLRAQLTADVEEHGAAQQFRVVEPPTLPVSPSSPHRSLLALGAAGVGLVLGFAIAFVRRMFDRSFHTEKEIRQHMSMPLVIAVPQLHTPDEEDANRRRMIMEWAAGSAVLFIVAAAEFYVYRHG